METNSDEPAIHTVYHEQGLFSCLNNISEAVFNQFGAKSVETNEGNLVAKL